MLLSNDASRPGRVLRRRSVRASGVAVAGVAVLVAGTPAAIAAPPTSGANLPSIEQVASVFPVFADGSREVAVHRRIDVRLPGQDCTGYGTVSRSATGKWASYLDASGDSPYFSGGPSPTIFVFSYETVSGANEALQRVNDRTQSCLGTHGDDSFSVFKSLLPIPALVVDDIVGFKERVTQDNSGTPDSDYFMEYWFRKGKYIVNARVQKDTAFPKRSNVVTLARMTLNRL